MPIFCFLVRKYNLFRSVVDLIIQRFKNDIFRQTCPLVFQGLLASNHGYWQCFCTRTSLLKQDFTWKQAFLLRGCCRSRTISISRNACTAELCVLFASRSLRETTTFLYTFADPTQTMILCTTTRFSHSYSRFRIIKYISSELLSRCKTHLEKSKEFVILSVVLVSSLLINHSIRFQFLTYVDKKYFKAASTGSLVYGAHIVGHFTARSAWRRAAHRSQLFHFTWVWVHAFYLNVQCRN
jgi:hypothetical protein